METTDLTLVAKNNKVYAQVFNGENILITDKKGKFAKRIFNSKGYCLYVIRSGYYVLNLASVSEEKTKLIVSKVVGFSEKDEEGSAKQYFATCKTTQQKLDNEWTAEPPKVLSRAIRKIENQI